MSNTDLTSYQNMAREMFESVGQAIGIHVLLLVMEHALWQTKQKNEEASLIKFSEEGISFEELKKIDPARAKSVAHDFIMSITATLGHLVGMQLAQQLTEKLQLFKGEE